MQVAYLADPMYYHMMAGTARYTAELAEQLATLPDVDLHLLSTYPPDVIAARAQERGYPLAESVPQAIKQKALQYLSWHVGGIPGAMTEATANADVVHSPTLLVPPRGRCPLVVTVLDLICVLFPHYQPLKPRLIAQTALRRAVKDADALIAISEHTKQDLMRLMNVPEDRIFVTPLAADPRFAPQADQSALARHGIDAPYALYVGRLESHKNIGLLLRAFAALNHTEAKLVLVGTKGWLYDEMITTLKQLELEERVVVAGFVADEDLPALYTHAHAFVYPSRYEGFGLPVLEAMQCGAPVITTNVSSLPEVAGDAAILVSPDDVEGLTQALGRLFSEPNLRAEMRGRGLAQAARFSWQKTAQMTADVYRRVIR